MLRSWRRSLLSDLDQKHLFVAIGGVFWYKARLFAAVSYGLLSPPLEKMVANSRKDRLHTHAQGWLLVCFTVLAQRFQPSAFD